MVTEVRQRLTRDLLGRRGTIAEPDLGQPAAATDRGRTPIAQSNRNGSARCFDSCDPTKEIGLFGVLGGEVVLAVSVRVR